MQKFARSFAKPRRLLSARIEAILL